MPHGLANEFMICSNLSSKSSVEKGEAESIDQSIFFSHSELNIFKDLSVKNSIQASGLLFFKYIYIYVVFSPFRLYSLYFANFYGVKLYHYMSV